MTSSPVRIYFDFSDPISFLLAREIDGLEDGERLPITWSPFEFLPPPAPLTGQSDPALSARWLIARSLSREAGVALAPPDLVPWTRKAHELALYAAEAGVGRAVRSSIFEAYFLSGIDIGRVDLLVPIAVAAGLDATEAKATLDVDRFDEAVTQARAAATEAGISETPVIVRGERRLEGFHNRTALGTFLLA